MVLYIQRCGKPYLFELWKVFPREPAKGIIMKKEGVEEIKTQLWTYLQWLRGRIEELNKLGIYPSDNLREWEQTSWGRRNRWFLVDQLYYCRDEIEYWKKIVV